MIIFVPAGTIRKNILVEIDNALVDVLQIKYCFGKKKIEILKPDFFKKIFTR